MGRGGGPSRDRLSGCIIVVSRNTKPAKLAHVAAAAEVAPMPPSNVSSSTMESALATPYGLLAGAKGRHFE
jgi:hypothetical protein